MKIFCWTIETVVVQRTGKNILYTFSVETFHESSQSAMDIARMRVRRMLERENVPYLRITVCWVQLIKVIQRTKYEEYIQLYQTRKSKKVIMRLLDIPFWKVDEFHRRYRKEQYMQRKQQGTARPPR